MSRRNAMQAGRTRSRFSAKAKATAIAMINVQNSGIYCAEISSTAACAEFMACGREGRTDRAALPGPAVSNRQTRRASTLKKVGSE